MLNQSKLVFIAMFVIAIFTLSCEESDEVTLADSSAEVTVEGKVFTKPDSEVVGYIEFEFNDEKSVTISADLVNGTDTVSLYISLPELAVGTYTKAEHADAYSISTDLDSADFSTNGPVFDYDEDKTDYTLHITEVSDGVVKGDFTATVQQFAQTNTLSTSGKFVAVDLSSFLTGS
ncbi:hypothetical protein [Marinoscillum furvescens]|uniref:Uncharacterized protein n=1 Tax=Marinoscillum furvescens DSM 4134 TaxID=1122208 RepID=A0A3D9LA61_MARFU|nr:hypothetical protein [Marinoscillum furvescens]REE02143.1 hypothetical protein C7460_102167 [Marinoscillum furvescens DSM 4134]